MFTRENKLLFLIFIIFIAACIETDIYLPAFTDMMAFFRVSEETIQELLTWNFVGICASCPFYGPLSDAWGRKRPLMIALGLFFLGSLFTLFAEGFTLVLFGRILQGLGSGGCFTLGTAIIFDAFNEKEAVRALNKMNSTVPFVMAAAPMLGGYLNNAYGFRSNFLAIAICVLASYLICFFYFEETLPKEKRSPLNMKKILGDFKMVMLSVPFWQTTVIVSLMFAGYIAFLSGVSILYVMEFGVSKQFLPFYQAALLGAWVAASLTSSRAIKKWGTTVVKKIGTVMCGIGGIWLMASVWLNPTDPNFVTIAMMLYAVGGNWTQSLYFPEGMALFPDIKGITASLLTSARLLIAASVVAISSSLYNATIYPIAGTVLAVIVVILTTIICYERKRPKEAAALSEEPILEIL